MRLSHLLLQRIAAAVTITSVAFFTISCQSTGDSDGTEPESQGIDSTPIAQVSDRSINSTTSSSFRHELESMSWDDAFEAVRNGIRYEVYPGVLRGADGVSRHKSGNSIDQAILLAEAIADDVSAYRFAQGTLNEDVRGELLQDMRRREVKINADESLEIDRYQAERDERLTSIMAQHFWLEIRESESSEWTALDPSVPSAEIGETFARKTSATDSPRRSNFQQVRMDVKMRTGGREIRMGSINGNVAQMAFMPIEVLLQGMPVHEEVEVEEESGQPAGGNPFGGLLGGGAPPKKDSEDNSAPKEYGPVIGTEVSAKVVFGGQENASRPHTILIADPESFVEKIWIDFTLTVPGEKTRRFERALFESNSENAVRGPLGHHRYNISVVNGVVSREHFDSAYTEASKVIVPEDWEALQSRLANESAGLEDLSAAQSTENEAGSILGQLITLAFAQESDSLSRSVAQKGGVTMTHPVPRILISSIETRPVDGAIMSEINLDLRLDEVGAIPYDGMPLGTASLFQRARGMQESSLEGRVLERIVDSQLQVYTTVDLMQASQDAGIPLQVLTPGDEAMINQISGLSRWDRGRIIDALENGDNIIIPSRTVKLGDRDVIGWWHVDKKTGAFIGVMQGGEHQAMVQYQTTSVNKILSPSQGFMLGMLNGAVGTHVLLAAGMLKYGQYTQRLKEEVRAQLQYLNCVMCPEAKIEVSLGSTGGVSAQISSCYEFEILENRELSYEKSASLPFCDWYKKGVSCAASLILDGLTVSVEEEEAEGPSVDLTIPFDC